MQNPLQVDDPRYASDPDNPLTAGSPTLADAYGYNATAIGDWLAQQRAKSAQMGLWNEQTGLPTAAGIVNAGQQYGNALLASTGAPRFSRETINIAPNVNMRINPSVPEMGRLLDKTRGLRVLSDGNNIAVAPAEDTIHDEMLSKLGDAAHPMASNSPYAWVIHKDGTVIDANNPQDTEGGAMPKGWPLSLQLLLGQM